MTVSESEDGLAVLHEVELVAGDHLEVLAVGLEQFDLEFTIRGGLAEFNETGFLLRDVTLHVGEADPLRVKGESKGQQGASHDQRPHHTHRHRQVICLSAARVGRVGRVDAVT